MNFAIWTLWIAGVPSMLSGVIRNDNRLFITGFVLTNLSTVLAFAKSYINKRKAL